METLEDRIISLRPGSGTFDFRDSPPFALSYLSTYYKQPPTADETAVSEFLVELFRRQPPRGRFIELGCGPTIHHVFPFAPHVSEIHLADYLDDNLEQVRLWLSASASAHDWSNYAAMTLRHEGAAATPAAVADRERLAREKITRVLQVDLKGEIPRESRAAYDAVGCFYCAEEIGISPQDWRRVLGNVADYVRPGGTLYMAALAGMNSYQVRDGSGTVVDYPCACVTEAGVSEALQSLGFPAESLTIKTSDIAHPDCGLTGALVAVATKPGAGASRLGSPSTRPQK